MIDDNMMGSNKKTATRPSFCYARNKILMTFRPKVTAAEKTVKSILLCSEPSFVYSNDIDVC